MNRVSNPGANATRVPRAMTARSPLTSSLLWRTRRRASSRIDPGGIAGGGFPCRTAKIAWKASSSYAGRARSQAYRQPRSAGSEGSDGIAHPLLLAGEAEEDCLQGGIAVGPLGPELGKGPLAAQLPVVEDADPVAELLCDLHGVGGEQDPAAALGDVALEELLDDADGSRVEVVQRLVQDGRGGSCSRAAMTRVFCRVPLESVARGWRNSSSIWNARANAAARSETRAAGSRRTLATYSRNSRGVRASKSIVDSGTYPSRARTPTPSALGSRPKMRTDPEVGRTRPTTLLIVDDFPAPFEPRRP